MSLNGSGSVVCCEGICQKNTGEVVPEKKNKLPMWICRRHKNRTKENKKNPIYLGPGVHGFVPPVPDPSPTTDAGIPFLIFGVEGREVNGVAPSLQMKRPRLQRGTIEMKQKEGACKSHTHSFLGGFSLKVFIHIPVTLPLPAVRGQPEAVQRLVLQARDITPLPTVAWQQAI